MGELEQIVARGALSHGIDPIMGGCVVQQESSWNTRAYREEPAINDASYGLCQILYGTAKGMGYGGEPEGLYDPVVNVDYGFRYLESSLAAHEGHIMWALAGYNAGIGGTVATRRREGVEAWKDYAYPGAVTQWYGTTMDRMALPLDYLEAGWILSALGANSSSILGWVNQIGALEARVAELEAQAPANHDRARELGSEIIARGQTLGLKLLRVETRLRLAREVQQLGQAVQGL